MYLKYTTVTRKKKCIKFKIKHEIFKIYFNFFPPFLIIYNLAFSFSFN